MTLSIELTEKELREMVYQRLRNQLGNIEFNPKDVKIQVKSKQNWKSEWEEASFRATLLYAR